MRKIIPILGVAAGGAAAVLGAAFYTYYRAFYHPPRKRTAPYAIDQPAFSEEFQEKTAELMQNLHALPYEEVRIRSFDGTELRGHYYPTAEGAPLQIQFHGYKGTPLRDFCGGHALAREMGHNILLVEQRAHGTNRRRSISFGIKEKRDCLAWAEYAAKRFGKEQKIFLSGVSMGAATVLMASELPLPENVVGIIADCPYSTPREILCKVAREMGFPEKITYPFLQLGALVYGHFRLDSDGAVGAVGRSKLPILLIHGKEDDFVPCEMSQKIKEAGGNRVRLEVFPEATHGMSYLVDPERYRQISEEFCRACLQPHKTSSAESPEALE